MTDSNAIKTLMLLPMIILMLKERNLDYYISMTGHSIIITATIANEMTQVAGLDLTWSISLLQEEFISSLENL